MMKEKPDLLSVIDSKDMRKKDKIKFEDKKLSEMTLAEHGKILNEMLSFVEDSEDLSEEEKSILDRVNLSADQKMLAWGYVISRIQEAQDLISNENAFYERKISENKRRSEVLQNRIKSRTEYLKSIMLLSGRKKIEGPNYSVVLKKKPQSVTILENADLEEPERSDIVNIVVSKKWDKKKIKELIKNGEKLKTVKMSDPDFTILIKG